MDFQYVLTQARVAHKRVHRSFKLWRDASEPLCPFRVALFGNTLWIKQPRPRAPTSLRPATIMSQTEDPRTANRARFELELEFVQALANPFYLHSLAQQNILSQPAFVNFLKYLLYWKEKDYARFIQ